MLNMVCLAQGREILLISLILGLLTFFFPWGSPSDQESPALELEGAPDLEEAVKNNRVIEPLSQEEIEEKLEKELLYPYQDFDEVDPDKIKTLHKEPYRLNKDAMLEDIEFLFGVLKYGYAGYSLFGGDEKFDTSKKAIINEVEQNLRRDNGESFLVLGEFRELVRKNLSFIEDGHFAIDGERFYRHHQMHISEEIDFYRNEDGYYIREGEKKLFLEKINGDNPDKYLKLSLNNAGKLVYRPIVLSPEEEPYRITLNFAGQEKNLTLYPAETESFAQIVYDQYEKEDIPVVVNRRLYSHNDDELNNFIETAEHLEDKDIAILDLRGNPGGDDSFARNWIEKYSSQSPSYAQAYIDLTTHTSQALQTGQQRFNPTPSGWSDINYSTPKNIPNDRYLLVLIDSEIGSSGETFVRGLKQIENVILIGSNTAGVKTVGNIVPFSLPNSGIDVQIGTTLFLELDLNLIEGRGYNPDIWVEPKNALSLALKFINNYLR